MVYDEEDDDSEEAQRPSSASGSRVSQVSVQQLLQFLLRNQAVAVDEEDEDGEAEQV